MAVADDGIRAVLGSIEAEFDASIARSEDEAASDLAFSLLHDLCLHEALARGRSFEICLPGGSAMAAGEIGSDFVASAGPSVVVVPLARAVLRSAPGAPPATWRDRSLLGVLRQCARGAVIVEVSARGTRHKGRLVLACRDHLVVRTVRSARRDLPEPAVSDVFIALDAIEEVRVDDGWC